MHDQGGCGVTRRTNVLSINEVLSILKNATSRLPQLRFAWGLLGISAVAALIIRLLGANNVACMFIQNRRFLFKCPRWSYSPLLS